MFKTLQRRLDRCVEDYIGGFSVEIKHEKKTEKQNVENEL